MNKKLHIICFDVPYPPTYGGVMDVFFKIKTLFENGIQIYLHVFKYGRMEQAILKEYCIEVNYYPRKTSFGKAIGLLPYIVASRTSKSLVKNLEAVDAPILFEGLHSTLVLKRKIFEKRKLLVRAHNIEHQYYARTAKIETNLFKKIFYSLEAGKLKYYEKTLRRCHHILSISEAENDHFKNKYGEKATYIPAFHPNKHVHKLSKKGYFALYHGNLNVSDNLNAAMHLIEAFKVLDYPLVIAGQTDDKKLLDKIDQYKNISFIDLKDHQQLLELFHRAHINILYSTHSSGVKLKLINALFQSRYTVANDNIIKGSGLEELCHKANTIKEIQLTILKLIKLDFSDKEIETRKRLLSTFNNNQNALKVIELINT